MKQAAEGLTVDRPMAFDAECPNCKEKFSGLEASGLCYDCDRKARRDDVALVKPEHRHRILANAGVPPKYLKPHDGRKLPGDPDAGVSLGEWTGNPWSAYLWGPCGNGKTMAAVEMLWRFRQAGITGGRFVKAAKVPGIYFGQSLNVEAATLEMAPVLVIDELGRGHLGKAWEKLAELIGERFDAQRPTIVTTNIDLETLGAKDEAIADRFNDGLVIMLADPSERGYTARRD